MLLVILRICLEFSVPAMRIFSLPVLLSVVSNAPLKVLVPEFVKVRSTGATLYASLELVRSDLYCFVISMEPVHSIPPNVISTLSTGALPVTSIGVAARFNMPVPDWTTPSTVE